MLLQGDGQQKPGKLLLNPGPGVGHSLKDYNVWTSSVATTGRFTGLGNAIAWINALDGSVESIYWDAPSKTWKEDSKKMLFDWTTASGVTDLTGALAGNDQVHVLDINDDTFGDISFVAAVKGEGSAFEDELWVGTALSAKQKGGPALFDTGSVNFQKHPVAKNWNQVKAHFSGKFDGDNLDDMVLVQTGNPGKIYVLRAKSDDM